MLLLLPPESLPTVAILKTRVQRFLRFLPSKGPTSEKFLPSPICVPWIRFLKKNSNYSKKIVTDCSFAQCLNAKLDALLTTHKKNSKILSFFYYYKLHPVLANCFKRMGIQLQFPFISYETGTKHNRTTQNLCKPITSGIYTRTSLFNFLWGLPSSKVVTISISFLNFRNLCFCFVSADCFLGITVCEL